MEARNQTASSQASQRRYLWLLLALSAAVLLSRALFLPPTLEDIDSVNFALALDRFDPSLHQPHPPGYPVYVALGRLTHAVVEDPATALSLLSALAQAALVFPLFALFRRLSPTPSRAFWSTLLAIFCPVLWFNGARPMSDSVGLLFVTSTQALLLRSIEHRAPLFSASLLAGVTLGVRLQTGLLTLPLWLFSMTRTRTWGGPVAALAAGVALWGVPLVVASGGPSDFVRAFAQTMGDAAGSEPLLLRLNLNRAARAAFNVILAPWVSPAMGGIVTILAGVGFLGLAVRQRRTLALAALAFGPYLVMHTLIQQVETVRYSLPYIPAIAWLTVEGLGLVSKKRGRPGLIEGGVTTLLVVASASLTLPALAAYHRSPSPPYAALDMVRTQAANPQEWVLAGHYMFSRYFHLAEGLQVLRAAPGDALPELSRHFRTGDPRKVLFLAYPRRTDLVSFSRNAGQLLGRWGWPAGVRPFLSGERPNRAELFEIKEPLFLAGEGWLLSLESGRVDELAEHPQREAWIKPLLQPSFLLIGGTPEGATIECTLDIEIPNLLVGHEPCAGPVLRGYHLPPAAETAPYLRLSVISERGGVPTGMPFALKSLDYGPVGASGFVHADGWFSPETDETSDRFRWASPRARSLLHVPAGGARLSIGGIAPIEYLGSETRIEISENGVVLTSALLVDRSFHLQVVFEADAPSFREIVLSTSRSFVPDSIQRNGDRRELAVRVYRFTLDTLAAVQAPRVEGPARPE